jgi:arginase
MKMRATMRVELLSVPYDSGIRGVRMGAGPDALLASGLPDRLIALGHDVKRTVIELPDGLFLGEVQAAFELNRRLAIAVAAAVARDAFPIVLSGNCITSIATVSGLGGSAHGVVWFDAHADFNTPETTPSGFLDGMALAILTGRCWQPLAKTITGFTPVADDRVMLVGARHLDDDESFLLAETGVIRLTAESMRNGFRDEIARLGGDAPELYVHVDLDVLDPSEGRANSFAVPGGLSRGELLEAIAEIARASRVRALALTAYEPACDADGRIRDAANDVVVATIAAAQSSSQEK